MDLLAALPLDIVILATDMAYWVGMFRILKLLRCFRLMVYVETLVSHVQTKPGELVTSMLNMLNIFSLIVMFCHVTGCMWFSSSPHFSLPLPSPASLPLLSPRNTPYVSS